MWIRPVVLLLTATAIGCAPPAKGRPTRNSNVLTAEEMATTQFYTAYDAIQNLRPHFLRTRGQTNFETGNPPTAQVFLNGQRYGDIETLRQMTVASIREIRYLSASDATTKYGTGYIAGVIEVSTR